MMNRRLNLAVLAALFVLIFTLSACAAEIDDGDSSRTNIGRNLDFHDFEPRDRGAKSQDRNGDGWPDFWIPVIDADHPSYLANNIRIVPDPERPGPWRGAMGHALRLPFDGTGVAVRTRVPFTVNSQQAYRISFFGRSQGLDHSDARLVAVWLHVNENGEEQELDRDYLSIPPGQIDWVESPLTIEINQLPQRSNALRLTLEVTNNPATGMIDRHGIAWFDDIRIAYRPRIEIEPASWDMPADVEDVIPEVRIRYLGLVDNVPDPLRPGLFRGKHYRRTMLIQDMFGLEPNDASGRPIQQGIAAEKIISPHAALAETETVQMNISKKGVYYMTVALFDIDDRLLTRQRQTFTLWPALLPIRSNDDVVGDFGTEFGSPPDALLTKPGALTMILRRSGLKNSKINVWRRDFAPMANNTYLTSLAREIRDMRAMGISSLGVITADPLFLKAPDMQSVLREQPDLMNQMFGILARHLVPHIDGWQWAASNDSSLSHGGIDKIAEKPVAALAAITATQQNIAAIDLAEENLILPDSHVFPIVSLRIPGYMPPLEMLARLRQFNDSPYFHNLRIPDVYTGEILYPFIPPPPPEMQEEEMITQDNPPPPRRYWLNLEARPVSRFERNITAERTQLADLAVKSILAKAVGVERIYLSRIDDEDSGIMARGKDGIYSARPAFMALRTLEEVLGGAKYMGSFVYRENFPNMIFRQRDGQNAVMAIWYNGEADYAELDLGVHGLYLWTLDLSGNQARIPPDGKIIVRRIPSFVMGMSASLAQTAMGIRILDNPAMMSRLRLQDQVVEVVNYLPTQLSGTLRFDFATDSDFRYEPNWSAEPMSVMFNLPMSGAGQNPREQLLLRVRPASTSDSGFKWISVTSDLNLNPPIRLDLLRKVRLQSDLFVQVQPLQSIDTYGGKRIQVKVEWFPLPGEIRTGRMELAAYYQKQGELRVAFPGNLFVEPNYSRDESVLPTITDVFIPDNPPAERTWIVLEEQGGDRMQRINITPLLRSESEL